MAENNKGGGQKSGGLTSKIVGAVVLVVIILLIVLIKPKDDNATGAEENVVENTNDETALTALQPVMAGDYEYAFQGVKWIFDTESAEVAGTNQTWLKMEFADFTRNGNAIAFGKPYKLGVHSGTCRETDFVDTATEPGIPFAYAVCEGDGVMREFVVLQESENVVVKMKETKANTESVWKEWYKIDVTEIVR